MLVNKVNLSHSGTQIYVTFSIVKFINILTFSFQWNEVLKIQFKKEYKLSIKREHCSLRHRTYSA